MVAIDFPNSPSNGTLHTVGDTTWRYDGTTWNIYSSSAAVNSITLENVVTYSRYGSVITQVGAARFKLPFAATILGVTAAVNTAPTGANMIIDVNKNGTTIFTTQGNRPTIIANAFATASEVTNMDIAAVALGDYLTVDVDQVGSTIAGADLTVTVRYQRIAT